MSAVYFQRPSNNIEKCSNFLVGTLPYRNLEVKVINPKHIEIGQIEKTRSTEDIAKRISLHIATLGTLFLLERALNFWAKRQIKIAPPPSPLITEPKPLNQKITSLLQTSAEKNEAINDYLQIITKPKKTKKLFENRPELKETWVEKVLVESEDKSKTPSTVNLVKKVITAGVLSRFAATDSTSVDEVQIDPKIQDDIEKIIAPLREKPQERTKEEITAGVLSALKVVREEFSNISQDSSLDEKALKIKLFGLTKSILNLLAPEDKINSNILAQFGSYNSLISQVHELAVLPLFESYKSTLSLNSYFLSNDQKRPQIWNDFESCLNQLLDRSLETFIPSVPTMIEGVMRSNGKEVQLPDGIHKILQENRELKKLIHEVVGMQVFNMTSLLALESSHLATNQFFKKQIAFGALRDLSGFADGTDRRAPLGLNEENFKRKEIYYGLLTDKLLAILLPHGANGITLPYKESIYLILKEQIKTKLLENFAKYEDKSDRFQLVYELISSKLGSSGSVENISQLDPIEQRRRIAVVLEKFMQENVKNPTIAKLAKGIMVPLTNFLFSLIEREDFDLILRKITWNVMTLMHVGIYPNAVDNVNVEPSVQDLSQEVTHLFAAFNFLFFPVSNVVASEMAKKISEIPQQSPIELMTSTLFTSH